MKAFAFLGKNKVGLVDKPMPEPGPNEAVVRATASLVCTSDVHTVHGVLPLPEGRVLGHESVGIVHRAGAQVTTVREGDRVAVCAVTPCGKCSFCQRGHSAQCGGMLGGYKFTAQREGNLAEYFLVNDADYNVVPIPQALSDEQALYATDMMSTGFAAAEAAEIPLGGAVAVFAQGPVGLCATAGARLRGAGLVIAVEGKPERQKLAKRFGADVVVDPGGADPVAEILRLTGGAGVDAAIEAVGCRSHSRAPSVPPGRAASSPTSATTESLATRSASRLPSSASAWPTKPSVAFCALEGTNAWRGSSA